MPLYTINNNYILQHKQEYNIMTNTTQTELNNRIIAMMTENTGISMLDSGGADGRMWQRNGLIDDFDNTPVVELDVYEDGVIPLYSVYHYLVNFLEITPESEQLNESLKAFMADSTNSYMQDAEDFIKTLECEEIHDVFNTYNTDNILSQILQYTIFEDGEGDYYIVLQIHGGCDSRGGYGTPQIFSLGDDDAFAYFSMAQTQVYTACDCGNWDSDDAGNNYYFDGGSPSPDPEWNYNTDDNTIACRKCGKTVVFSVMESF